MTEREELDAMHARLAERGIAANDDVARALMRAKPCGGIDMTTDPPTYMGIPLRICEHLETP